MISGLCIDNSCNNHMTTNGRLSSHLDTNIKPKLKIRDGDLIKANGIVILKCLELI